MSTEQATSTPNLPQKSARLSFGHCPKDRRNLPGQRSLALSSDGTVRWKAILLRFYGRTLPSASQFPKTMKIINDSIPKSECTLIMFSVLPPNQSLPPHVGPNHAVLRYHLGLSVPVPSTLLVVNGEEYVWRDGDDALFDDTFLHSAHNLSNQQSRVVLFLDVLRPFPPLSLARCTQRLAYTWVFPRHQFPA